MMRRLLLNLATGIECASRRRLTMIHKVNIEPSGIKETGRHG